MLLQKFLEFENPYLGPPAFILLVVFIIVLILNFVKSKKR